MALATVLALVGFALSARMVQADRLIAKSITSEDQRGLIGQAHDLMPGDPSIADLYARVLGEDAVLEKDEELGRQALAMAERTVQLDPESAINWVDLGVARERLLDLPGPERYAKAREAYLRAHELNPWNRSALYGLFVAELGIGDKPAAAEWEALLCELDACPRP